MKRKQKLKKKKRDILKGFLKKNLKPLQRKPTTGPAAQKTIA
ncbi:MULTISPECIES: hypothetical protein [Bacillaceae]|nr:MULTISPECIES: hypothetical protein [Bacillaceae]